MKAAALREISPKTHFSPRPLIRVCASDRIWGAHTLRVAHPHPIAQLKCERSTREEWENLSPPVFKALYNLSHRLSLTHRGQRVGGRISAEDFAWVAKATKHAVSDFPDDPESKLAEIAGALQIPDAMRRSDFAWVGSAGPKASSLVLPEATCIPAQLQDLALFFRNNRRSESNAFFEALAYQLLMIHPLRDGNGRSTRFIVLQLALASRSSYAMYFAWRLIFDKQGIARKWQSPSADPRDQYPCMHYRSWLDEATSLASALHGSNSGPVDPRIADAITLFGQASVAALTHLCPSMGNQLARKLIEKARSDFNTDGETLFNEVFERRAMNLGNSMKRVD
jgi:hypothetical protein